MARPLALVFVFTSAVGIVTALILPSCSGLPSKTCYGDRINAFAADAAAASCTTCVQNAKCCDVTGACGDDPTCIGQFKATQLCVALGGAAAEPTCKGKLTTPKSQAAYACARSECGSQCGIPSCDLDPAVVLIDTPACDTCITGSCCPVINECYGNRNCKLFIECITKHCPISIGTSMTRAGAQPHDQLVASTSAMCGDGGTFDPAFDPGPCLDRCLEEFAPGDAGATSDDLAARCLAFEIYTCGAGAGCGPSCINDGGSALDQPYPEDTADSAVP